jgi:hypothetical protein
MLFAPVLADAERQHVDVKVGTLAGDLLRSVEKQDHYDCPISV